MVFVFLFGKTRVENEFSYCRDAKELTMLVLRLCLSSKLEKKVPMFDRTKAMVLWFEDILIEGKTVILYICI